MYSIIFIYYSIIFMLGKQPFEAKAGKFRKWYYI